MIKKANHKIKICRGKLLATVSMVTLGLLTTSAIADPTKNYYSGTVHGGVGLLETRTARFAPDGSFEVGASFVNPYRRYYINWQIFPWMEATFRYVDPTNSPHGLIGHDQSQNKFWKDLLRLSSGGTNLDRGFDVKFKLFSEGEYRPAIALGLQDFIGTGLFEGEYVVASKKIGDFDFSLGLGWGRLGSKGSLPNPFKIFGSKFSNREIVGDLGGNANFGRMFRGETAGLFGGIEYLTPVKGLTLKLEYNGAKLSADRDIGDDFKYLKESIPLNFGLNYRIAKWFDASIAWERGNTLMFRFALRADFSSDGVQKETISPPKLKPRPKIENYQTPSNTKKKLISNNNNIRMAHFEIQDFYNKMGLKGFKVNFVKLENKRVELSVNCNNCESQNSLKNLIFSTFPNHINQIALTVEGSGQRAGSYILSKQESEENFPVETYQQRAKGLDLAKSNLGLKAKNDDLIRVVSAESGLVGLTNKIDAEKDVDGKDNFKEVPPPSTYISAAIMRDLSSNGFWGHSVYIGENEAKIYLSNWAFLSGPRNVGWVAKMAANRLPEEVEVITVIEVMGTIERSRVSILRKDMENFEKGRGSHEETWVNAEILAPKPVMSEIKQGFVNPLSYPSKSWWITPELVQHIGNPTTGVLIADVNLDVGGSYTPLPGLTFSGVGTTFLVGNLDKIERRSDSVIHHVRSDIVSYLQEGRTGIKNLQVDYFNSFAPGWYGRVAAGLFEQMYGGVGLEVLHRPFGKKWALGLDVNWVKQRDFNQLFRFRKYNTVTGHLTLNYELPFYGMRATVSAGRYLAGDKGVTLEFSRRFKSGIRVGAFATFTNLSAEEFGEGSFDKGFYISIPLELLLTRNSKQHQFFGFKPLTRDGGQKVAVGPSLFAITDGRSPWEFQRDWEDFYK